MLSFCAATCFGYRLWPSSGSCNITKTPAMCRTSAVSYVLTCLTMLSVLQATHIGITLVDFQLDAQNSYLFIYNTFIKILHVFRALPCSSSGGLRRNCIYAASGVVTVFSFNRCTRQSPAKSDDTRGYIYTITT